MKLNITAAQAAFYTKNGYLELEDPTLDTPSLFASMRHSLRKNPLGRDLWRIEPKLKNLLTRKIPPIAFSLTGKKQLRLACDQWIPAAALHQKPQAIQELICIQGLCLGLLLRAEASPSLERGPLGLLPLPADATHLLFFRPDLLLDWATLARQSPPDLYLALYSLPNAVYVHNNQDAATNVLKSFGYAFGDVLKNEFHPLLIAP